MRSPFIAPAGAVQPDQRRRVEDLHLAQHGSRLVDPHVKPVSYTCEVVATSRSTARTSLPLPPAT